MPRLLLLCLLPAVVFAQNPKPTIACDDERRLEAAGLVDVQTVDATLLVDLKYSTTDNFIKKDVYGCITRAFLQKEPARMLAKANKLLQEAHPNYRLLVYDGARSRAVQRKLWAALPQYKPKLRENYVANPDEGSIHNFGCAVDLTVATAEGQALDMGTSFDYFGDLAYPRKEAALLKAGKLTREQVENRKVLRSVMEAAGFEGITSEWWHFNAYSRKQAGKRYGIIE
ncbi:MAG: M15 family metallopeptidase [Sphingobacteriaceae bacterium]|nr:M15 family metallopeptidase [Cytophagaceae bacterium]